MESNIASKCLKSNVGNQYMNDQNKNKNMCRMDVDAGDYFQDIGAAYKTKRRSILLMSRVHSFTC